MYNDDGYMFVAIMAPHRLRFAADDLLSATKEEEALAEETYLSYCGRYDFLGDTVVHHVEMSLFPNWIGGDQVRVVDLRGNRLTLSTRAPITQGHSADCTPDLGARLNARAVDSLFTEVVRQEMFKYHSSE